MPEKFLRCVRKVKRKNAITGYSGNPWAICRKSTGFYGSTRERKTLFR